MISRMQWSTWEVYVSIPPRKSYEVKLRSFWTTNPLYHIHNRQRLAIYWQSQWKFGLKCFDGFIQMNNCSPKLFSVQLAQKSYLVVWKMAQAWTKKNSCWWSKYCTRHFSHGALDFGARLNVAMMAKLLESFYDACKRSNIKEHLHS